MADPECSDGSQGLLQDIHPNQESDDDENENLDSQPRFNPQLEDIRIAYSFIDALKNASLDSTAAPLDKDLLERLRHPAQTTLTIDDQDDRLSLDIFLSVTNASEETYSSVRNAILHRYPESCILTYYKVKQLAAELSGVVPIIHDMCPNSCIAYTGAFTELLQCPQCNEPRYEPGHVAQVPRQQFHTLPIGPQLQALWRTPEGAHSMRYRQQCTEKTLEELIQNKGHKKSSYRDFFDGKDYLEAVQDGRISTDDMVLVLSIDGAQLYRNKVSECWIYIWIILDHAPEVQYKKRHVLPGGIIPGPNKPKNLDSFLFPGLYHLTAL